MPLTNPRTGASGPPSQDLSICDLARETGEQRRLEAELKSMEQAYGTAEAVVEFASDRRKLLLATYSAPHKGESVAAQENLARQDDGYMRQLDKQQSDYASAKTTIRRVKTLEIQLEAVRTRISLQKSLMGL